MATTTTNGSGYYEFANKANGNYRIVPTKTDWAFTPASREIEVSGADEVVDDFVGYLSLPYTYSLDTTEADGTAIQLADPLWQKYSAYAAPVVSSSVTDSAGTNCGASKVVKFVDNDVDQRGLFVFPKALPPGITKLRVGILKRAAWENSGTNPWCTLLTHDHVDDTGDIPYASFTRSTGSNPNQVYLVTRYTLNGGAQTEMNWSSITEVISSNVAGHRWVWNMLEMDFIAQTVRVEARRYGQSTEYYRSQTMHANGISAGSAPQFRSLQILMTPAGSNPGWFAKLWIGTGDHAWFT
jgi:hypothetical protein